MILFAALIYAAYTDLKRREIEIWLFPSVIMAYLLLFLHNDEPLPVHIIGGLLMGLPSLFAAMLNKLGGGDVLLYGAVGFVLGLTEAGVLFSVIVLAQFSFAVIFVQIAKVEIPKEKEVPMALPLILGQLSDLSWVRAFAKVFVMKKGCVCSLFVIVSKCIRYPGSRKILIEAYHRGPQPDRNCSAGCPGSAR